MEKETEWLSVLEHQLAAKERMQKNTLARSGI